MHGIDIRTFSTLKISHQGIIVDTLYTFCGGIMISRDGLTDRIGTYFLMASN